MNTLNHLVTIVRRRETCVFSLIELLIVVAIIALLCSILLPSLKQGRDKSMDLVCLSNLRQLGSAGLLYMADNRDFFPALYFDTTKVQRWYTESGLGQYLGMKGVTSNLTKTIFWCPRDPREPVSSATDKTTQWYKYAPTYSYIRAERDSYKFPRANKIQKPGDKFFIADGADWGISDYNVRDYGTIRAPQIGVDTLWTRHANWRRFQPLFFDGHVGNLGECRPGGTVEALELAKKLDHYDLYY